ncbi:MAG: hypothetical protein VW397_01500 [Candidatus Margulisiibacteriota bacterium]
MGSLGPVGPRDIRRTVSESNLNPGGLNQCGNPVLSDDASKINKLVGSSSLPPSTFEKPKDGPPGVSSPPISYTVGSFNSPNKQITEDGPNLTTNNQITEGDVNSTEKFLQGYGFEPSPEFVAFLDTTGWVIGGTFDILCTAVQTLCEVVNDQINDSNSTTNYAMKVTGEALTEVVDVVHNEVNNPESFSRSGLQFIGEQTGKIIDALLTELTEPESTTQLLQESILQQIKNPESELWVALNDCAERIDGFSNFVGDCLRPVIDNAFSYFNVNKELSEPNSPLLNSVKATSEEHIETNPNSNELMVYFETFCAQVQDTYNIALDNTVAFGNLLGGIVGNAGHEIGATVEWTGESIITFLQDNFKDTPLPDEEPPSNDWDALGNWLKENLDLGTLFGSNSGQIKGDDTAANEPSVWSTFTGCLNGDFGDYVSNQVQGHVSLTKPEALKQWRETQFESYFNDFVKDMPDKGDGVDTKTQDNANISSLKLTFLTEGRDAMLKLKDVNLPKDECDKHQQILDREITLMPPQEFTSLDNLMSTLPEELKKEINPFIVDNNVSPDNLDGLNVKLRELNILLKLNDGNILLGSQNWMKSEPFQRPTIAGEPKINLGNK